MKFAIGYSIATRKTARIAVICFEFLVAVVISLHRSFECYDYSTFPMPLSHRAPSTVWTIVHTTLWCFTQERIRYSAALTWRTDAVLVLTFKVYIHSGFAKYFLCHRATVNACLRCTSSLRYFRIDYISLGYASQLCPSGSHLVS